MARKLKTYTTSAGFFDLAVAAPSMKAALEAWGAETNLFHQGFARQSDDQQVIAATMARPGTVLRRPVGTNAAFSEHAQLPTHLGSGERPKPAPKRPAKPAKAVKPVNDTAARKAALAFEREKKRQEAEARREEVARTKERERRDRAIEAADAALEEARQVHQSRLDDIEKEQQALDRRKEVEAERWTRKEEELEAALRRARAI